MKRIIFALLALGLAVGATAANAGTLNTLQLPAEIPTAYYYRNLCAGESFSLDGAVLGSCYSSRSYACSGRGCVPVTYISVFNVAWDASGAAISTTYCGQERKHRPQPDTWTYQLGFDASTCALPGLATASTVAVDGVSYYYVATSGDGQYEILNGQSRSYVYQF